MTSARSYFTWENVIHCSQNKIEVMVPSVDANQVFAGPAATGTFKVRTNCGEVEEDGLMIPYSLTNFHVGPPALNRGRKLIAQNTDADGVVFRFSPDIPTTGLGLVYRNAFAAALDEWCIATNANFSIGSDLPDSTGIASDSMNVIAYSPLQGSALAGLVIQGYEEPCGNDQAVFLSEFDFKVKKVGTVAFADAKHIFLHELGHAHMLNHSRAQADTVDWNNEHLMFPTAGPPGHTGTITTNDKTGALNIFPNAMLCANPLSSGNCGINSVSDHDHPISVLLYPNPAKNILTIENRDTAPISYIAIYNQMGAKVIIQDNIEGNKIDISTLPSGAYTVATIIAGRIQSSTFIKICSST